MAELIIQYRFIQYASTLTAGKDSLILTGVQVRTLGNPDEDGWITEQALRDVVVDWNTRGLGDISGFYETVVIEKRGVLISDPEPANIKDFL